MKINQVRRATFPSVFPSPSPTSLSSSQWSSHYPSPDPDPSHQWSTHYPTLDQTSSSSSLSVCREVCHLTCRGFSLTSYLLSFLPILSWLPRYSWRKDIVNDLVAGFTVAVMHIPQVTQFLF